VALAIRTKDFSLQGCKNIHLCTSGDRVALLLWLKHTATNKNVLIANTHLSFPHSGFDRMMQLRQMQHLMDEITAFGSLNDISEGNSTRIIVGDFNVEGASPVCDLLKQAGYYSCFEVSPPVRENSNKLVDERRWRESAFEGKGGALEREKEEEEEEEGEQGYGYGQAEEERRRRRTTSASSFASTNSNSTSTSTSASKAAAAAGNSMHLEQHDMAHVKPGASIEGAAMQPQMCTQEGADKWVSHHTHRNEDLGVDHIFIKPQVELLSHASGIHSSSSSSSNASTTMTTSPPSPQIAVAQQTTAEAATEVVAFARPSYASGVFVAESAVLPLHLACDKWQTDFLLSDHRPVLSTLVFGVNKKTG